MADTFPLKLLLLTVSGWFNRHEQDTIAYLVEENRILKEKLGGKCPPVWCPNSAELQLSFAGS